MNLILIAFFRKKCQNHVSPAASNVFTCDDFFTLGMQNNLVQNYLMNMLDNLKSKHADH